LAKGLGQSAPEELSSLEDLMPAWIAAALLSLPLLLACRSSLTPEARSHPPPEAQAAPPDPHDPSNTRPGGTELGPRGTSTPGAPPYLTDAGR
jgi:hypothetical protein